MKKRWDNLNSEVGEVIRKHTIYEKTASNLKRKERTFQGGVNISRHVKSNFDRAEFDKPIGRDYSTSYYDVLKDIV